MNSGYYHRKPTSASVRPLPQNRQAFSTLSQPARPGVNSAQPFAYQGMFGGISGVNGVRPGTSSLPQFGQSGFGAQAMRGGLNWARPQSPIHSTEAFSPMNPGPVNPFFHGGLRPTQQQQYDMAMEHSRRRYLLNRNVSVDNRIP